MEFDNAAEFTTLHPQRRMNSQNAIAVNLVVYKLH